MDIREEFWHNCSLERFTVGKCQSCDRVHYYPQMFCPYCGNNHVRLTSSGGEGYVLSYSHVMSSFYPKDCGFPLPYTVVKVKLNEGIQVVSKMLTYCPTIGVGSRVSVAFETMGGRKIPVFISV